MHVRSSILLFLALGACSWVGDTDFEARLLEVDDDADGDPAATDCDDHDGTISSGTPESWYDGIDQDCAGGDDYDVDQDGYVYPEDEGKETAGVPGSGALPGGDCDDDDPMVSPQQPDEWYDGVDQDCDGADDFDQDGDGYVEDDYVGATTLYAEGTGALPGGDCDDLISTVGPEQTDEWYDGVDTDCGGEDDWDQDADGFVPTDLYEDYTATTYVDGSGGLPNGDCDDLDATVNPLAIDDWYDGTDSDCVGDSDYDQDGDGYLESRGGGDDCDDTSAEVYPGALEILGDADDSDCDDGNNTFSLETITDLTWSDPHDPVFDESSDRVYLSIAAQEIETSSAHYYDSAVALVWASDDVGDGRDGSAAWLATTTDSSDYELGAGQAFVATDDYLYGVLGLDYGDSRAMRLVRYATSTGSRTATQANGADGVLAFDDLSAALDDNGDLHAVGCDASTSTLHYVRVPSTWAGGFTADVETSGIAAADCAVSLHGGEGHVFTSESGALWDYSFDVTSTDPVFAGVEYSADYAPLDIDVPADWDDRVVVMADAISDSVILLAEDGVTTIAEGEVPLEVDVFEDADGVLYVGYLTPGGDVHLAWGDATSGFTDVDLGVDFAASDISVWASGGYLMYAAVGEDQVAVGLAAI